MNEAQALGGMHGGVQNLGIQTNGVLILLGFFVIVFFSPSAGMELRALYVWDKCSTIELHSQPINTIVCMCTYVCACMCSHMRV